MDLLTRLGDRAQVVSIDPKRSAVVIIDPWNHHWCMTAAARVGALVPRWNRALAGFRRLGMTVIWAPTEAASQYAGWPQRERAAALARIAVPRERAVEIPFTVKRGPCMCGPGIACPVHYGLSAIHPGLTIVDDDYIVSGSAEVYSLVKERHIAHVLFMGLHTNLCLAGRPEGIGTMRAAGVSCIVCRDMDDAFTHYVPGRHTPDDGSQQANLDLEHAGVPTIHAADALRRQRLWDDATPADPVRLTPWGTADRPYLFESSVAVTLTFPNDPAAVIRYTTDDTQPTLASPRFDGPIDVRDATTITAAAFRDDRVVSLPGRGVFLRLPPAPPTPDVYLDQLTPIREDYPHWYSAWQPVMNASFERTRLRIADAFYDRGVGMRAPANLRYAIEPRFRRFVAGVGVDAGCIAWDADRYGHPSRPADDAWDGHGSLYAQEANVRFRVFLDGRLVAESPPLRTGHSPWRFDVPIPPGARQINLVAIDAGQPSILNYGDWVDAGFVV